MIFRLDGVTKQYGRGHCALRDVTADVRPGSIGLLGPNGAGKSTLIKVLLGLVRLTDGNASVFDLDVRRDARRIREIVGYMPEDDCYIAGLKGIEMVARSAECAGMPPQTALRRSHEMLDYVRLGDARYREVQTYSTGMKQRAKLALALVHAPKLVFLDEPTSGMDPEGREQILSLVRDLATEKGVSVVMSTHILHDVEACCDSVLILGRGELLKYGSLSELQQDVGNLTHAHIDGDVDAFTRELQRRGLDVQQNGRDELTISGAGDIPSAILNGAHATGARLRGIKPARTSLEEIFLNALRGGGVDADS